MNEKSFLPTLSIDAITTPRVDIDEQRRREIEDHQKFGSIRKQQHELPEYQRDVIGPRLPVHGLPLPSTSTQG